MGKGRDSEAATILGELDERFISRTQGHVHFIWCSLIPILISRFLLNLRQVTYGEQDVNIITRLLPFSTSQPRFRHEASVVGNLGEPLDHSLGVMLDDHFDNYEQPSRYQDEEDVRTVRSPMGRDGLGGLSESWT